jgi:hypothetical protein
VHLLRKLAYDLGELRPHGGGQIRHTDPRSPQPNLVEQVGKVLDPALGVEITFQVMTIAFQSTGHQHPIRATFEGV